MHLLGQSYCIFLIWKSAKVLRLCSQHSPLSSPPPLPSGGEMNHGVTCRLHAQLTDSISPNPERSAGKWAPPPSTQSSRTPDWCWGIEAIPSLTMLAVFVMRGYNEFFSVNKALISCSVTFESAVLVGNSFHNCCVATTNKHDASYHKRWPTRCIRTGGE